MSSERTTPTIEIGKGVEYAKVAARLAEMHKDNQKSDISTSASFVGDKGACLVSATVVTGRGSYMGHSFGKVGAQKALEKLETIAVGRALAFAGYLSSGEIASYEEMEDLQTPGETAANKPGVTRQEIIEIKEKWKKHFASEMQGKTPEEQAALRADWVKQITGRQFDPSKLHEWRPEDISMCLREFVPATALTGEQNATSD